MGGVQARQRIDLEEVRHAPPVGAQVDPRGVAAAEQPVGGEGHLRRPARLAVVHQPVLDELFAELLVVEGVDAGLGSLAQHHLEHADHPRPAAGADDADGELPAAEPALHQHRLPVAGEQRRHHPRETGAVLDARGRPHALAGALGEGLGEERQGQVDGGEVLGLLHHREGSGGQAGVAHHPLGGRLVEGEGAGEAVAEGAGDAEALEQRRHLRLPPAAAPALADVEHEVPAGAAGEAAHQPVEPSYSLHREAYSS
ncbi:hypothetical protein HRbin39_01147 [bacterium HR39]|nr:hypothetical protein HRbin39_01147 [bacterium HR39]